MAVKQKKKIINHRSQKGKRVYTGILIRFSPASKIDTNAFYQTRVSLEIIEIQAFQLHVEPMGLKSRLFVSSSICH